MRKWIVRCCGPLLILMPLPLAAQPQKPSQNVTVTNTTPIPVTLDPSVVPVINAQQAGAWAATVTNTTPIPVKLDSSVTTTIKAEQAGAWKVSANLALADQFQVTVLLTAAANSGGAQIQVTPPGPILIEQIGAVCAGSEPKMVRVTASAEASLAAGFTTSPSDDGNKVSGAWFGAQVTTFAAPQGFSGGGVPPTPTRMVADGSSGSLFVSFFREIGSASISEYCYVSLAGRRIQ